MLSRVYLRLGVFDVVHNYVADKLDKVLFFFDVGLVDETGKIVET